MYDAGGRTINIYKSGYKYLQLALGNTAGVLSTDGKLQLAGSGNIECYASSGIFILYTTGVLKLPNLSSAPSGVYGGICMVSGQLKYWNGSAWVNA